MPFALDLAISLAAFLGHFAIAVWLFNRLHAVGWPRTAIKVLEKVLLAAAALVCALFAFRWLVLGYGLLPPDTGRPPFDHALWLTYAVVCWTAAIAALPAWLIPKLLEKPPAALVASQSHAVDVAARLGFRPVHGAEARFFAAIPGNELLRIEVQRKTLRLPNLPPELAGLSIAHLSDLHMTGQVGREYYDVVVDETNALAPDLIVITGDILEKERCLPWIPQTLGRLQARHGKYFILGNHERRLKDAAVLRAAMVDAGFSDLGGRCETVTLHGVDILLAGTELPWFGAAPDLQPGTRNPELGTDSLRIPDSAFRILLSHSPDQLPWARLRKFDLVLAGHNHGGQIRLPYLGALIVPSHFGWRYAGGLYDAPPTMLHVSRGLGGIHPIRLNCPPELALLVLQSA
ncbi:MAG TPA: metallophosphoesterase [Pirellulaceae bacterium]|nr:metallophosphoesterase [Pirellulaceae bacterium]